MQPSTCDAELYGGDTGLAFRYFVNGALPTTATGTALSVIPRALRRTTSDVNMFARQQTWSFILVHP